MVSSPLGNCPDAAETTLKGGSEMNRHDLITAPLAKFSSQVPPRGRPIKFTPERIQQIRNLVERGKSREKMAELIGTAPENRELVTPESPPLNTTGEMRTMPPQTAVILWILIILALIVPAVAGMRLLPPPW